MAGMSSEVSVPGPSTNSSRRGNSGVPPVLMSCGLLTGPPSAAENKGYAVETAGLTIAAPPTYTISPQDAVINADQQEFYTITTTNVADGTVLYWHIGTSANAAVADASGQVTITNNTAQFAYTPSSTELAAVMDLYVKTDGQGGTAVATTGVTVVIQSGA